MIQIPESLLKRNEQRHEELIKRKEESPSQADVFRDSFKQKQMEIENKINSLEGITDRPQLSEQFNQISKDLNLLNKYLATSSMFLIAYDHKICRNAIQTMLDRTSDLEKKLLPKKKFGFTSRKDLKKNVKEKTVEGPVIDLESITAPQLGFTDRSDETLSLSGDQVRNKDVTLARLHNCTVLIHGSPNTLHLVSLSKCKVLSGPVVTSVFVDRGSNSVFAFPCQQLRIHNTTLSDFYIHVTTKAIIEDTVQVRFAPYAYSYEGLDEHYRESKLDRRVNNWDAVDDFNWLVNSKQSPNWSLIPPQERVEL